MSVVWAGVAVAMFLVGSVFGLRSGWRPAWAIGYEQGWKKGWADAMKAVRTGSANVADTSPAFGGDENG